MLRRVVCAMCALFACHEAPPAPTAKTPEVNAPDASAVATDAAITAAPAPSIRELASAEDWPAVIAAIDASPALDDRMKFLRARAKLETGDARGALASLEGVALPEISSEVDRLRALAELEVGPFTEAATYFSKRADSASQLAAARAWLRAGDKARALAVATNVVRQARSRAIEAGARALRLRAGSDPEETADARWLLTKGADLPEAADATLAKRAPVLDDGARVLRMRTLADAGKVDDALAEVTKLSGLDAKRARGDVLYRGRRYAEAARALTECAEAGGAHAAEDAFFAARALSRDDRDEDAAKAWSDLIAKYPRSSWSDESAFMIARLDFLHARWAEAARGFDAYLTAHPYGVERKDALRGRAIAKLLAGDAAAARALLAELARREPDPISRARIDNLQAIAANKSGDTKAAIETWTRVATSLPLTWPSLVARARLAEAKAPLPAVIDPARSDPHETLAIDLPPDVRLLHELGLDTDAERRLAQHESSLRASVRERTLEALCTAYGGLDRGKRRFALSGGVSGLDLAPGPGTRWAWDCAFPTPYSRVVARAEAEDQLPVGLAHAVMRQESGFDPEIVSPARAVGLMQLLPETADAVAKEMNVAHDASMLVRGAHNATLGAHYLATLLTRFKGTLPLAVAAYNCGPEAVEKWSARATGLEVDMFVETIPYLETRGYVVRVMANYARYAYLARGDAPLLALSIAR